MILAAALKSSSELIRRYVGEGAVVRKRTPDPCANF